jgi:ATP-dependent RNA helicase RhlE
VSDALKKHDLLESGHVFLFLPLSLWAETVVMTETQPGSSPSFYGLGIAPKLLEAIDKAKLTTPTPIQQQAIPVAIQGQDVVGIAQTGTGKTFAFGIPMIQRIAQTKGIGLVIVPTRELAVQVDENLQKVGRFLQLRTSVLIGGANMSMQIRSLKRKPHIIVATPGRLIDHLEQKTVKLDAVSVLVLDEADRMFDMGFAPQINRIMREVPKEHQTLLFSATMPEEVMKIASRQMKLPTRIEIARAGTLADRVEQELFVVRKDMKIRLLQALLTQYTGTVLVFTRTKFIAKKVTSSVLRMGHTAAEIHSNRSLAQRRKALDGFKSGAYRVLVATDIAARGIDVKDIELVINYDIPDNPDDYVHRIGRTGRAGSTGRAITFAAPEQGKEVRQIERLARIHLPVASMPELPAAMPGVETPSRGFGDTRRGQVRGGRAFGNKRPSRGGYSRDRDAKPAYRPRRERPVDPRQTEIRQTVDRSMRNMASVVPDESLAFPADSRHRMTHRTRQDDRRPKRDDSAAGPKRKRRVIF